MSLPSSEPVLIVGGGLAGLACARELHRQGVPFRLFEASGELGGRVRTDKVDGFLLDRGFQVYLEAYPEAGRLLDLEALRLGRFEPGALVFKGGRLHRLMDVFRRPAAAIDALRAPIGGLGDKLRVGLLRHRLLRTTMTEIDLMADTDTADYLRQQGFSDAIIESFFRSFYGGIFLERDLATSSRMFAFTFKMFSSGAATLPADGMGAIPRQMARPLPSEWLHCRRPVGTVRAGEVILRGGERVSGRAVVLATDGTDARALLREEALRSAVQWRPATTLYFAAPASPVAEPIICLNGEERGLVNNVAVCSDVCPHYAPPGQSLISVSVLGPAAGEGLEQQVQVELVGWFGPAAADWKHLRTYRIPRALPVQPPGSAVAEAQTLCRQGVWIAGDSQSTASIEGAVTSGLATARELIRTMG